jgi:hypothetical protein
MKTVSMIFFTVIVLSLATTASADTSGWGLGIGSFDGDFGIQGRKDPYHPPPLSYFRQ